MTPSDDMSSQGSSRSARRRTRGEARDRAKEERARSRTRRLERNDERGSALIFILALGGFAVGASLHSSFFGGVTGMSVGLLVAWLRKVLRQVGHLSDLVDRHEARIAQLEIPAPTPAEREALAAEARAVPVAGTDTAASPAAAQVPGAPSEADAAGPPTQPAQPTQPTPPPRRPTEPIPPSAIEQGLVALRELALGGNTVVRVGVLVLLVGVLLLAKWAADHSIFPIEARLGTAALIGLALTGVGYRLRSSRPGFATTLQGGGIAALYLVVFSAFRFFDLVPTGLAFGLFVVIAAAGGALAVLQSSLPLIFIGSLGGFLAPILASSGQGNHVILFSYYLVLNTAIAAVALMRSWRPLNLLAFVCTYGVATVWGVLHYEPEHFGTSEPFLLAYMLLFTAVALLFARRQPPRLSGMLDGTLVFGTPLVTLLAQARLVEGSYLGLALSAAGFGLFYAALAMWLWRTAPQALQRLAEAFIALAVGFGTMAIPFAVDDALTTAVAWALEGAGIYWVGARQHRRFTRGCGVALQALAAVALFKAFGFDGLDARQQEFALLANGRFFSCVALAFGGLFIAREAHTAEAGLGLRRVRYDLALIAWGLLWWAGAVLAEIDQFAPSRFEAPLIALLVGATALALEYAGSALGWLPGRLAALTALPAAGLVLLTTVANGQGPLAHGGALAWPACLVAIYHVLRRLEESEASWIEKAYGPGLWLLAGFAGFALASVADRTLGLEGDWPIASFGLGLSATLLAALHASQRGIGPFGRHPQRTVWLGAGPVSLVIGLWCIGINMGATGEAAPLPFVPLLNPTDLSLAVALMAALSWRASALRSRPQSADGPVMHAFTPLLLGLAFVWLNGMLARTVHQWTGVAFDGDDLWRSTAMQATLSIAWTLVALGGMVVATRQHWRRPWLIMAALLGVVVVKLFVIDLSRLGTGAKIVTFLVVGVLLLVVGYLSPVPPSEERESWDDPPAPPEGSSSNSGPLASANPGDVS